MLTIKQLVEMYRKELNSIINCEKNFFISKDVGVDGKVLKAMSSHGLVGEIADMSHGTYQHQGKTFSEKYLKTNKSEFTKLSKKIGLEQNKSKNFNILFLIHRVRVRLNLLACAMQNGVIKTIRVHSAGRPYLPFEERSAEEARKYPRKECVPTHRQCKHFDPQLVKCKKKTMLVKGEELRCRDFIDKDFPDQEC